MNALIKCGSSPSAFTDCVSENANSGYYLNSGKDSTTNQVIKCSNSGCLAISITEESCSKAGSVINKSSTIKLCIGESEEEPVAITGATSDSYETILLTDDNVFPDTSKDSKIAVKVSTDGYVYLLEEASLPECSNSASTSNTCIANAVDGSHCIKNGAIYKSTISGNTKKCEQVTGSAASTTEAFYFNESFEVVTSIDNNSKIYYAYECETDASKKVGNCSLVKGYTTANSKIVKCNGWKGEQCEVGATSSCTADCNGELSSTNLVFASSSNKYTLPTDSSTSIISFELTKTSGAYGALKEDIILLSVATGKATSTTLSSGKNI